MNSILFTIILLSNITFLIAMPSIYSEETDEMDNVHVNKRLALSSWLNKRNHALCDYRLQLRPLPLNSALCNYGKTNAVCPFFCFQCHFVVV